MSKTFIVSQPPKSWMDSHNIFRDKEFARENDKQIKKNCITPKYTLTIEPKIEAKERL